MINFSKPIILGHRGLPSKERENTLSSFKRAISSKADGIELDVHLTKDKKLAVIHDHNTKRTTGIDAVVEELTLKELKQIDSEIPTLREVFETFGSSIIYDIEIKEKPFVFSNLPKLILDEIYSFHLEEKVMVSSFNPFPVRDFKRLCKTIPTAIIYDCVKSVPKILQHGQGKYIAHPDFFKPGINIARKQITKLNKPCSVWCIDSKADYDYFIRNGAKIIITNRCDEIINTL